MAKEKKALNLKLYAVVVFFIIAGLLATITVTTYKNRYNGFSAEKTALAFIQSIVETGDGYNAYKNAVVSKNYKYGDFIREYYIYPIIYSESGYKPGDSRDGLKGFNDDSFKGEKTLNDNGSLTGEVIDSMYPYYKSLIKELNGWDNYDAFFTKYFTKLCAVREKVFGDKYMTDEIMFTALEANVLTYGESLTGTEDEFDSNTGIQTSVKSIGDYETAYGEDYKINYEIIKTNDIENLDEYKASINKEAFETYRVSPEDINAAKKVVIEVTFNSTCVAKQEINLVKINSTWYVDNTNIDTSELYKVTLLS